VALNRVQGTHAFDSLARDLRRGLLRIDDFSFHVRPEAGARDLIVGDHTVVAAIGIGHEHLVVILQKTLRSIAAAIQREVEDVVRLRCIANVDLHARIRCFALTQHGQDRVVGGHHV
jgi:hypothetical protein